MHVSIPSVMALRSMKGDKPTIKFTTEDVPELKDWKVGEQYKFEVTATLVKAELDEEEDEEESDEICGCFDVEKIKVIK